MASMTRCTKGETSSMRGVLILDGGMRPAGFPFLRAVLGLAGILSMGLAVLQWAESRDIDETRETVLVITAI